MILVGKNLILLRVCEGKKLCWEGSWKKFLRFKKQISVCMFQQIGYNVRWKLFGQKGLEDRDWGDFASDIRTNENR